MAGKRPIVDWVGLGVIVTLLLGLGGVLHTRLNRIEDQVGAIRTEMRGMDRSLARIEGLIEGAGLFRPADGSPTGD